MNKPKHRLQITFAASEIPNLPISQTSEAWKILPAGEERVFTFDSDRAFCQEKPEYFEGHDPGMATGNCWYSWMQPTPWHSPGMSLRVLWWEIIYTDGSEWIAGAVLNESMEAPLGRLRGNLGASLDTPRTATEIFTVPNATLSDENGCCFEFGQPKPWVHPGKLRWYVNRFKNTGQKPPDAFWTSQPCSDARQGDAWQPQWTPFPVNLKNADGSWVTPKYWNDDDPRNPAIGHFIGQSKVADWYLRQTHGHFREGGQGFRTPWETGFLASPMPAALLKSLWEYTKAQVGGMSPTGQGYIDGRPNHLSLLHGTMFQAGKKYNLNEQDKAAPFTAVLHEGRPQIGKQGQHFWECFGREKLHWIEVTASQFKGLYMQPNGSDFEHCASGPLAAASILYGDPLAQRQLHHICEEHLSQGTPLHSTRSTSGWLLVDLADGYLVFQGNSIFSADAERYREGAFQVAATCWQARYDQTPYKGMLTVAIEKMDTSVPENQRMGYEATMQLAIALHAACVWYQLEGNEVRREFWLALIKYIALECLDQPGVIDWSRGGIIQRYSLQTPIWKPGDPGSASENVEKNADPAYQKRVILSDEGWVIPALAEAWMVTGIDRLHDMALEGYRVQNTVQVGHGQTIYSPLQWSAWGQNYEAVRAFGWAT